MKKTIVSLTILALERDSRTLKMAASFARFGYRSIVIERIKSSEDFSYLDIEVLSIGDKSDFPDKTLPCITGVFRKILQSIACSLRFIGLGWINRLIIYNRFRKDFSLKKINVQADIYVFHSYKYVYFALSLPANMKIIYDAHDFYQGIEPISRQTNLARLWAFPFYLRLEKIMINLASTFTTVSPGLIKKYKEEFGKKPLLLMNAHDFRNDISSDESIRDYLKLSFSDIIVCIVGTRKSGMALENIINVFGRYLTNVNLVFVGNGYEFDFCPCPNIYFIPARKPNRLIPFIKSANLGIVPYFNLSYNYKFSLPNGFFQMIAAGLPLIFSKELTEVVSLNDKYNFGMATDIESALEIKKSILTMINNLDDFKQNLAFAASILNWEVEEKKLKNIIKSLD